MLIEARVYISVLFVVIDDSNSAGPWIARAFRRPLRSQKRWIFSAAAFCLRVKGGLWGVDDTQRTLVRLCFAQNSEPPED